MLVRTRKNSSSNKRCRLTKPERLEDRRVFTTFFVDGVGGDGLAEGGDDFQVTGSLDNPFLTIERAAIFAQPGDTIAIRGGVYREEVSLLRSGSAGAPITIRAVTNEDLGLSTPFVEDVTVTTTDLLTNFVQTPETDDNPNVFVATLEGSNTNSLLNRHELTVFVNGQLVQEASSNNTADYLDVDTWDTFNSATATTIQDNSLIGSTDDIVGGFVRVRVNNFVLEDRRIAAFNSGTGTITLDSPLSQVPTNGQTRYLIHDARDLVDSAGEWYFNEETSQFFLFAPGGVDPNNAVVEVTRRAEAFDTNGNDHITFENLTLTGGDFDVAGSDNIVIDGVHIIAPDRIFGPDFGTTRTAINFSGNNNIIRNSEIEQVWSAAIRIGGSGNIVANNFFHDTAFNGGGGGAVATSSSGAGNLISHNTFTRSGRAHIVGAGLRNIIQNNEFTQAALLTEDVGAIYYNGENLGSSIIRYNVFHDIEGTFSSAVYTDNDVGDLVVHNNIIFDTAPFGGTINTPNSFVNWFNNTVFESGFISEFGPGSSFGSRFNNNIVSGLSGGLFQGPNQIIAEGNFDYNDPGAGGAGNFVDAAAGDFRLTAGSSARNAGVPIPGITPEGDDAPDAGALQFGEEIFDFGHDFAAPPDAAQLQSDIDGFALVVFSNAVDNGSFERGLESFSTLSGTPTLIDEGTENFTLSTPLGIDGANSVQLNPGDGIQQTITGLLPNTTYTLTASARIVGPVLQAENASSSAPIVNTRGSLFRGQLQNGDEVRFNNIDFGANQFDTLQVALAQSGPGTTIEVFLDDTSGAPLRTFNAVSQSNFVLTFISETDLPAINGAHDLILRFSGSGNLGLLDEIRLLDSTTTAGTLIGASGFNGAGSELSQSIGSVGVTGNRERLEFRTGPSDTTATIFLQNPGDATFDAYVDGLTLAQSAVEQPVVVDLSQTQFDYDLGVAFQPSIQSSLPFELLTTSVSGDISFSGPAGSFDAGPQAGVNAVNQDFLVGSAPITLNHRLANGTYRITVNQGDPQAAVDNQQISAEGVVRLTNIDNAAGEFTTREFEVTVTDGELNLEFSDTDTVNPRFVLNRLSITLAELVDVPDGPSVFLPGDFNSDQSVNAADFVIFRDTFGASQPLFAGADLNGSGEVDSGDFEALTPLFGTTVGTVSLLSPTVGNGSFENLAGASPDLGANRIGGLNATATIPGFTAVAQAFGGFDDDNPNGASDGSEYAFVNSGGAVTVTSDPLAHTASEGEVFTVSVDVGNNQFQTHDYEVRLIFGDQTQTFAFTDGTNVNAGNDLATFTFEYTATSDNVGEAPVVEVFANNTGGNAQLFIDNLRLDVETVVSTAEALTAASTQPAAALIEPLAAVSVDAATVDARFVAEEDVSGVLSTSDLAGVVIPPPSTPRLSSGGEAVSEVQQAFADSASDLLLLDALFAVQEELLEDLVDAHLDESEHNDSTSDELSDSLDSSASLGDLGL